MLVKKQPVLQTNGVADAELAPAKSPATTPPMTNIRIARFIVPPSVDAFPPVEPGLGRDAMAFPMRRSSVEDRRGGGTSHARPSRSRSQARLTISTFACDIG